jgi:hypothetical protein
MPPGMAGRQVRPDLSAELGYAVMAGIGKDGLSNEANRKRSGGCGNFTVFGRKPLH